ncbi:hypothetical protein BJX70DRAFT_374373 [Aspergillus crustosus]
MMSAPESKSHSLEPTHVSEVDSEPQNPPPIKYKRHPVYSLSEWLLEITSSILSLGLLIAIACIFRYMDNKPLSDWSASVSLSATISILTTAYTTSLMHGVSQFIGQLKWLHFKNGPRKLSQLEIFDGASRGVWGSILLLTTVKWNIATVGAFITILRLTVAPFAQQVIQIEQRDVFTPDEGVAFGYAHRYFREIPGELANAGFDSAPQDPKMQSAVIQGLYGIDTPATFNCPGACRWTGSYTTLGFKSDCQNVTQETLRSQECARPSPQSSSQQCNMTTPGGLALSTNHMLTESGTSYYMNATSMLGDFALGVPDTFPEITRFALFRSTPDHNFVLRDINITECSLSVTGYEYTNAKANGSDFAFDETRTIEYDPQNPWRSTNSGTGTGLWGTLYTNDSLIDGHQTPGFEISYSNLIALVNFFESQTLVTEWIEGSFANANPGLAAALAGNVDITDRFNRMASSMTDYLRYGPNTLSATGERVESVPFVEIRWPYFIVPILTEAVAVLFAGWTILANRGSRNVPLWKSSMLAALACRVEKGMGLLRSDSNGGGIEEILEEAGKVEVRLQ